MTSTIAVIDFETTGLSPGQGDRATEVAIVLVEAGRVVGRFQSLMNAGVRISAFIESFTGISNAMVAAAPPAAQVMADAARFVGSTPMVAHNAAFDRRFWQAELALLGDPAPQPWACTLLLARRLYPESASHKLGTLAALHCLPSAGRAHRAMADAEVAAHLLARIQADVCGRFGLPDAPDAPGAPHALLMQLQRSPRGALGKVVERYQAAFGGQKLPESTPMRALQLSKM
jgi:DNA polymerase-3 subunit epsilon